jgi:hypothetical protein
MPRPSHKSKSYHPVSAKIRIEGKNVKSTWTLPAGIDGIGALVLLLATLFAAPGTGHAVRYQDASKGHDFVMVGVGALRVNLTDVEGDEISFEDSDEGLPRGYSNRSYLYLNGEGVLYHDIDFRLKTYYDEENPRENFKFLLNAKRQNDYLVLGDHEYGVFQDTVFTAMDNYVRGLTLHGQRAKAGATLMGGVLRGETRVDDLRGDGTSGPYRLEEAPVLEGTEGVKIETRDRTNPDRVLNSVSAVRGKDYSIDYDNGEITFASPVDEQDFRGNPVFIVVTYQFDSPDGRWQRATGGTRVTFAPNDQWRIGATYLADAPWENGLSGQEWDQRRQIYGSDITFKLGDRYRVNAEVARSEIPLIGSESAADGLRLRLDTNPLERLRLYGRYWKVDEGFLTFGNRDLASQTFTDPIPVERVFEFRSANLDLELDPNITVSQGPGEETLGLSGSYDIGNFRWVSAGFRHTEDNPDDDADEPIDTVRSAFASVKQIHPESTRWLVGTEVVETFDDSEPAESDAVSRRVIGAVRQPLGAYAWTGPVFGQVAYQFEDAEDRITEDESVRAHDLLGRLEILPLPRLVVYAEQAERWLFEVAQDQTTRRTDATMVGLDGRINRFFDLGASARFRRENDLVLGAPDATEEIYTLRWHSQPLQPLKFRLRTEYRTTEDHPAARTTDKTVLGGQVFWDIHANLRAMAKYRWELEAVDSRDDGEDRTVFDDLYLRLDYRYFDRFNCYAAFRLEHDEIDTDPLEATRTEVTTILLGARYQINDRFDFTAAYRQKMLSDAAEDDRLKYFGELGYQINRFLKIALGVEHFRYTAFDDQGEYDADVAYISLIGKL